MHYGVFLAINLDHFVQEILDSIKSTRFYTREWSCLQEVHTQSSLAYYYYYDYSVVVVVVVVVVPLNILLIL